MTTPRNPVVPPGWLWTTFEDTCQPISDGGLKVLQRHYQPSGAHPIIDQGVQAIAGYCDDGSKLFPGHLPVLAFGDHTRRFKLLDRPFVVGADGLKLIQPSAAWNPKCLWYFFQALDLHDRGYSRHFQFLRKAALPLPPLNEQDRITEAAESLLSRLDAAGASLEAARQRLKAYRASVLKAAVEGRLVPTEAETARKEGHSYDPAEVLLQRILKERRRRWEEAELAGLQAIGKTPRDDRWKARYKEPATPDTRDLPKLPEGWQWASCEQILERLQTGPFGSSLHKSDYVAGGTPVINPEHLRRYGIHPSDNVTVDGPVATRLSAFRLVFGDLVLGRRGEMGRCAVVGRREEGWLLGTGSLALRPAADCDPRFLAWVLRSPHSVRTLSREAIGTTMTNLNQEILLGLAVPLPPCSEQTRIVEEIERQFSLVDAVEQVVTRESKRCGQARQAILKWAFDGKLVDQDQTDEAADALLARIRAERLAALPTKRTAKRVRELKVAI